MNASKSKIKSSKPLSQAEVYELASKVQDWKKIPVPGQADVGAYRGHVSRFVISISKWNHDGYSYFIDVKSMTGKLVEALALTEEDLIGKFKELFDKIEREHDTFENNAPSKEQASGRASVRRFLRK
jgi:hypothetical protein